MSRIHMSNQNDLYMCGLIGVFASSIFCKGNGFKEFTRKVI